MAGRTRSVAEKSRACRLNFAAVFHAASDAAARWARKAPRRGDNSRERFDNAHALPRFDGGEGEGETGVVHLSGPESGTARSSADAEGGNDICAAFVIDADGNVLASNSTARELWRVEKRSLVATPFVQLFVPASDAAGETVGAWAVLKTDAGQRWKSCIARSLDGAEVHVRVRIERAFGGGGSYIAVVQPTSR